LSSSSEEPEAEAECEVLDWESPNCFFGVVSYFSFLL
jgi:hypothetical protein